MKVITGKDLQGHVLLQLFWVKILAHVKEVSSPSQWQQITLLLCFELHLLTFRDTRQSRQAHSKVKALHCLPETLFIHAEKEHQAEESWCPGPYTQTHLSGFDSQFHGQETLEGPGTHYSQQESKLLAVAQSFKL